MSLYTAAVAQTIIVNDYFRSKNLVPALLYGDYSVEQVTNMAAGAFVPAASNNQSLGYCNSPVWFKFSLNNPLKRNKTVVFSIGRKDIYRMETWQRTPDGQMKRLGPLSGEQHGLYPFRLSNAYDYVLMLPSGTNEIWLKNTAPYSSTYLCFGLYDMNAYAKKGRKDAFYLGAFGGVVLIFAFLTQVLFFAYKDSIYLRYFLYLTSLSLLTLFDYSVDFGYIPFLARTVLFWVVGLTFVLFLYKLSLQKRSRAAHYLNQLCLLLWASCTLAALVLHAAGKDPLIRWVAMLGDCTFLVFGAQMAYLALNSLRQRGRNLVEVSAYFPLGLVFTLMALRNLGFAPNFFLLQYGIFAGLFLEAVILTFFSARAFRRLELKSRTLKADIAHEKQQREQEVALAEQKTKDQIAKELHNDIAASLSGLRILSKVAYEQMGPRQDDMKSLVEKINRTAQSSADSLSDLIWTVKPHENYLNDMADRFRDYCYRMLGSKQIEYSLHIPRNLPIIEFSLEKRRNIYLIFKEAINNAARHSGCTRLTASLELAGDYLTMFIKDNGQGFDAEDGEGMGLSNMRKRASDIGARLVIESEVGEGTNILFYLQNETTRV